MKFIQKQIFQLSPTNSWLCVYPSRSHNLCLINVKNAERMTGAGLLSSGDSSVVDPDKQPTEAQHP